MSDVYEVTTNVALQIVMKGVEKTVKKQDLTKPELLLVGRALGWLALVTAGTNVDLFKQLSKASTELKEATKNAPESMVAIQKEGVAVTAGKRHRKRMRGGVAPAALILGAIAMLYGGNTAMTINRLQENRRVIRSEAIRQIQSNCPIDLLAGAPEKPLIDWTGEYARKLSEYTTQQTICDSTKSVMAARIKQADETLAQAWSRLPNDAAAFATVSTMVLTAPAGPAAAATSAATLGAAVKQITETVISGQLPNKPEDINKFVKAVSEAFPQKEEEAAATPAPAMFTGTNVRSEVINPAVSRGDIPEAAAPARRGRGRKTKKTKKVRRATRRRLTFSY